MSEKAEIVPSAIKFVALTLFIWAVLAVVTALIMRLVYGVFIRDKHHTEWLASIDFGAWHWGFKAIFLGSTLLIALWVVYKSLFKGVDEDPCKKSRADTPPAPAITGAPASS